MAPIHEIQGLMHLFFIEWEGSYSNLGILGLQSKNP